MVSNIGDAKEAAALLGISYGYAYDLLKSRHVESKPSRNMLKEIRASEKARGNKRMWSLP